MLKVAATQRDHDARVRGRRASSAASTGSTVDASRIPTSKPATPTCFAQGYARGGARFYRLEGMFRGENGSMSSSCLPTAVTSRAATRAATGFRTGYGQL